MQSSSPDWIGAAWLAQKFDAWPLCTLPIISQIGGRRASQTEARGRLETFTEPMRPAPDATSHLQFHLRHEITHLEFLARLFEKMGPLPIQDWINREPTGQYARRAAFLYEWLTGRDLTPPPRLGGNYVKALDDDKLITASPNRTTRHRRWRIYDNLPGTPWFCPTLVKTPSLLQAAALDIPSLLETLNSEFGKELLMRAAVWMTLRESKASFAIEGEADRAGRVQRFADVMARRTGADEIPLDNASLSELQRDILGDRTTLTSFGLRKSPVFVGESIKYTEVVHYIAPPADEIEPMLEGLRIFLERTVGQSPVLRSAVAAFGLVYIHPLADGNGRAHRFLINDVLRRDGALPDPIILPVSGVIMEDMGERRRYDDVLDLISKPLMHAVRHCVSFDTMRTSYEDGVVSNLSFTGDNMARPLWRYPTLDAHVIYLANILQRTLTEHMREQSQYLRAHTRARAALKDIVEMPDHQADRVLRSMEQNQGALSNVLAKEMPILNQPGIWEELKEAVQMAFESEQWSHSRITDRYRPGLEPNR